MDGSNNQSVTERHYKWDAFICHASEDKDEFVRNLALALKEKIDVWYDEFILTVGDSLFAELDRGLKESKYGIVIISPNLLKYWTGKELDGLFAKETGGQKVILPIRLNITQEEVVRISPILAGRVAAKASDGIDKVVKALLSEIKPELFPQAIDTKEIVRKTSIPFGDSYCKLPCYFPSVSSVKTRLKPVQYIELLLRLGHPLFLVSAYDIYKSGPRDRKRIKKLLNMVKKEGCALIADSGNYESYWKEDKDWKIKDYQNFLKDEYPFQYAFSYDKRDQNVGTKAAYLIVNEVETRVKTEQGYSKCSIIPIIHSPIPNIISVVKDVVLRLDPIMVAVPERELGPGIIEKVKTLKAIRTELNRTGRYYPIHLLGTGNPLSMLIYSKYGADSFDGLEWCQTTVNHETGLLYHFQQREFFKDNCLYCQDQDPPLPYDLATFGHNLYFYRNWMKNIQDSIATEHLNDMLIKYIPSELIEALKEIHED
ncbi:TIR domain-containing protein [Chloroflexota bacterium]